MRSRIIGSLIVKENIVVQSFGFEKYLPVGSVKICCENLNNWEVDEIIIRCIDRSKNNKEIPCDERVIMALSAGCRLIIATTMQNNMLINEKLSHKYFSEKYLTKNIIEYYEKNRDKMFDIELPDMLNSDLTVYNSTLMNLNKWSSKL